MPGDDDPRYIRGGVRFVGPPAQHSDVDEPEVRPSIDSRRLSVVFDTMEEAEQARGALEDMAYCHIEGWGPYRLWFDLDGDRLDEARRLVTRYGGKLES